MRRAISKKIIIAERQAFVHGDAARGIPGAIANGVSETAAEAIYKEILDFANYAFNKAHAVCYAKVTYDTAYLKCHYSREYMAALLTSVLDNSTKTAGYIADCRDMGIRLLHPDINASEDKFTVEPDGIRFGLGAVKNIGRGLIRQVMAERAENGPFVSLEDFARRMQGSDLNKRAVENLIKCGAMDGLGMGRGQMLAIYEMVLDAAADTSAATRGSCSSSGRRTAACRRSPRRSFPRCARRSSCRWKRRRSACISPATRSTNTARGCARRASRPCCASCSRLKRTTASSTTARTSALRAWSRRSAVRRPATDP
ncbi:MAG: hypothetical protein ACLTG4_02790 [Oscillospiraceae bacterium]